MAEREKSALYPAVTWQDCIEFIKKVDRLKQKTVAYQAVAELYGLNSITTKSFTQRVGTAKQFGLITTSSSTIKLTDTARKILYPVSDDIKAIALDCFKLPPLYSSLINEFDGKQMPNPTMLANLLMNNYKISKSAKDLAAKVFLDTCEQLELVKAGVLCYSESLEIETDVQTIEVKEEVQPFKKTEARMEEGNTSVVGAKKEVPTSENEYIIQTYPVESGKVAKIIIPIDSTEDDLYAIRDLLEVIMKRKFKMKIQE